jgi:hypothetical protein
MTKSEAFRADTDFLIMWNDGSVRVFGNATNFVYFSGTRQECEAEVKNLRKLKQKT